MTEIIIRMVQIPDSVQDLVSFLILLMTAKILLYRSESVRLNMTLYPFHDVDHPDTDTLIYCSTITRTARTP